MKKMLVVLCAVALMLIPMSSMAAMQSISDGEMAAVTGQAGVDLDISANKIALKLQSISWGDPDGLGGTPEVDEGFINLSVPTGLIAHIGISGPTLSIDVGDTVSGTDVGETAVQITLSEGLNVTLDAFMAGVYLDSQCAVAQDYANAVGMMDSAGVPIQEYATWTGNTTHPLNLMSPPAALNDKMLGVLGISGLDVTLTDPAVIVISAH